MDEAKGKRITAGLRNYFEKRRWPRLSLGLIVLATAVAGLGLSQLLLWLGMTTMWQRYPLAVAGAYVIFLGLMRVWVEIEKSHFDTDDPEVRRLLAQPADDSEEPHSSSGWLDWLDFPDLGDMDLTEGCVVGILIASITAIAVAIFTLIAGAPALLAEVAVDILIVSALYKRLKTARNEHWLGAAVSRTWIFALITAVCLAGLGYSLQQLAPDAHTVGEAIRQIRQ